MKAAKAVDVNQWALADALKVEVENKMTGAHGFNAVINDFGKICGLDYSYTYLRFLRETAEAFPAARRYDGDHNKPVVSLSGHHDAASPDMLDALVGIAKKEDVPLNRETITKFIGAIRNEERQARHEQHQAAKREQAEAEAEAEQAKHRHRNAKTEAERTKATKERDAARDRQQAAKTRVRETAVPPRKGLPVPKEPEGGLLLKAKFMADAGDVHSRLRRIKKYMEASSETLTPAFIAGAVEDMLSIANIAREIADLLRKHNPGKRGQHLYAVND